MSQLWVKKPASRHTKKIHDNAQREHGACSFILMSMPAKILSGRRGIGECWQTVKNGSSFDLLTRAINLFLFSLISNPFLFVES